MARGTWRRHWCKPGVTRFAVLTTRHVLQSGLSRELFDAWCEDRRNGVIIADFAVQGTLAREILGSPSHVITKAGARACPAPCCLYSLRMFATCPSP